MLHLHLISSVSCPASYSAVSCILSVLRVFSLLRSIMSPLVCSRSVVFCYPRKSSGASLPPFFTFLSAVSDSCLFLPSHITIVRLVPSPIIWASFPVMSHLPSLPCIFSCSCRCHAIVWPRLTLFHFLHPSEKKHVSQRCQKSCCSLSCHAKPLFCSVLLSFLSFLFFFTDHCLLLYLIYDIFSLGMKFPFTIVCFLKYTNKISNKLF